MSLEDFCRQLDREIGLTGGWLNFIDQNGLRESMEKLALREQHIDLAVAILLRHLLPRALH